MSRHDRTVALLAAINSLPALLAVGAADAALEEGVLRVWTYVNNGIIADGHGISFRKEGETVLAQRVLDMADICSPAVVKIPTYRWMELCKAAHRAAYLAGKDQTSPSTMRERMARTRLKGLAKTLECAITM